MVWYIDEMVPRFIYIRLAAPLYSTSVREIERRWCQKSPHDFVPSNCGCDCELEMCLGKRWTTFFPFSRFSVFIIIVFVCVFCSCIFAITSFLGCNRFHLKFLFFLDSTKKKKHIHTHTLLYLGQSYFKHIFEYSATVFHSKWLVLDCMANNH